MRISLTNVRRYLGCLAFALASIVIAAAQDKDQQQKIPANPRLVRHTNFFVPERVYDLQADPYSKRHLPDGLAYQVYSAVGYDLANTMMIVGPDKGVIIVDTLGDADNVTKNIIPRFRKILGLADNQKLPIKAIIYTHNHIDHTGGVQGFLKEANRQPCLPETPQNAGQDGTYIANGNCVEIIGQKNIVDSVINTATVVGEIIDPRSVYMYGNRVPRADFTNNGIGPFITRGTPTFQMPSRTFTNELYFAAAGVNMKLVYVPSETDDEISVFIPDGMNRKLGGASRDDGWGGKGLLFSAEVIQGPSFPNLYSLRGTSYRNPATWFRSVDKLRGFDSWCMIPSHGPPLCGQENIRTLLRNFRDAIQFTHDQAVRFMNQGHTPPELAAHIKLPEYLITDLKKIEPPGIQGLPQVGANDPEHYRNPEDYLTPFYGSVPQAVREIYFGYLGWFEADPVGLRPTPPRELAERTILMMGNKDNVREAARQALEKGKDLFKKSDVDRAIAEWQWSAELTTLLIRADHEDYRARAIKAEAFDHLAIPQTNPNWRDWYITAAQELRLKPGDYFPPITSALVSPEIVSALPAGAWVNSWTMRLKAEDTTKDDVHMAMGFWFPADSNFPGQGYIVRIRRGIAEFTETGSKQPLGPDVAAAISMTREALGNLLVAEAKEVHEEYRKLEG
ncbi:MAG TPA: alkyl sulfatase dimerization domain-containing protein, partial [Blastocatellia bacterium]|nr:alkyl sulfatase dimerization domain-containing protein [Blastocatellia bacterium]